MACLVISILCGSIDLRGCDFASAGHLIWTKRYSLNMLLTYYSFILKWITNCHLLFSIYFTADSIELIVPDEVTGQLRKSATIPCIYVPSAQYNVIEVTWYFNTRKVLIQRNKKSDSIPSFFNRRRISINQDPGDVSLVLKDLAYSDRGTYTCQVKWLSNDGLRITKSSLGVNLIVKRKWSFWSLVILLSINYLSTMSFKPIIKYFDTKDSWKVL